MTCIAGVRQKGFVWIGGDSAGVSVGNLSIVARLDKKVFLKSDTMGNQFGFGFTSSFRMGQLLQFDLVIPPLAKDDDEYEYMVKTFVPEVRSCFKEGGYATVENNTELGGTFLVGVRGRLFTIDEDFQVGENLPEYSSCGCGAMLALGSLHATQKLSVSPTKRITMALEAAAEMSAGVRAPFHIVEVKTKNT